METLDELNGHSFGLNIKNKCFANNCLNFLVLSYLFYRLYIHLNRTGNPLLKYFVFNRRIVQRLSGNVFQIKAHPF